MYISYLDTVYSVLNIVGVVVITVNCKEELNGPAVIKLTLLRYG